MMKKSLIVGILLMILSGVVCVACLLAPGLTNDRVDFEEAMLGFVPSAVVFPLALALTIISAIFVIRGRNVQQN